MRSTGNRDLALFHGLEQGGLHLGRSSVNFIGKDEIAKNRAGLEPETPFAALVVVDFRARDIRRQQIGRELDTAKLGLQILR